MLALCPPGALVSVESTEHPFLETITCHLVHVCGVLMCKTPNLFFGQPGNLGSPQPCGEITGDSRLTVPRGASGISVLFPHSVCRGVGYLTLGKTEVSDMGEQNKEKQCTHFITY